MRCVAYCTAEKYLLNKIAVFFRKINFHARFYRNVLYISNENKSKEIFFFSIGSFVLWNFKSYEEKEIIEYIKAFSYNILERKEKDSFVFHYSSDTKIYTHDRFNTDIISLESEDPQIKLAISFGLAQSVKLESYEEIILKTIQKNNSLPQQMAEDGKISLTGNAISKRMGEIFLERSSINLSSEYLDMPEYFWQYPSLEEYYVMTEKYLDIARRVDSLNKRLDVLHDLFNMLTSQLQHRHSSMLETIIIVLIFIEIILNIFSLMFLQH